MKIKQTDMSVVVTENICSQSAYLKNPSGSLIHVTFRDQHRTNL